MINAGQLDGLSEKACHYNFSQSARATSEERERKSCIESHQSIKKNEKLSKVHNLNSMKFAVKNAKVWW